MFHLLHLPKRVLHAHNSSSLPIMRPKQPQLSRMMLFQMQGQWPDLAAYEDVEVGEDVLLSTRGMMPLDWS